MSRRLRGEGDAPYQMPDGRWRCRYKDPRDGIRKPVYGATPREAAALRDAKLAEIKAGKPVLDAKLTVGAWLTEYLEVWCGRKADRTKVDYAYLDGIVRPALGHLPLATLDDAHVEAFLTALAGKPNLNGTTQYKAFAYLRGALNKAITRKKMTLNPCYLVEAPKKSTKKVNPWDPDEIAEFLATVEGHPYEALYLVCIMMGLRQSEALGLRWKDINFKMGRLTIAGTLSKEGAWQDRAKTDESVADMIMPPRVLAALQVHEHRQRQVKFRWRKRWLAQPTAGHDLVFATRYGGPVDQHNAYHTFQVAVRKAGLRHQRFHDMRHMAASLQIAQGATLVEVAAFLRHADGSTATKLYTHLYDQAKVAAAARMDALFPAKVRAI